MDRTTYIGFSIQWLFNLLATLADCVVIISTASIYIGMFLYINGMKRDLEARLISLDNDRDDLDQAMPPTNKIWPIYIQEIDFHNEIIG